MEKKSSDIWNHFSVINSEKAKCSYCSNPISYKGGSTTNLSKHLKRKHIIQYEARKIQRVEQNVDDPGTLNEEISSQPRLLICQSQPSSSTNMNIKKTRPLQTQVDSYITKPISIHKQKILDEQLGVMISKEFQPFSLVENIEFKKFVYLLNPAYKLPSRKTISKSLLPQLLEKAKEKVKTNLINAKFIAFTTDGWTSINNDSFVAVTVHFIDTTECVLKSFLLGCFSFEKSHTSDNLSAFLNNCFKEWNISEKIKVAVTDNAANMTATISMNKNWRHIPCLAHTINLIAQSGLDEINHVHKKVKKIVEFFKRSTQSYAKLKNAQIQMGYPTLKLIQDVITRWNSTHDMFQRCIEMKEPLISTLAILGNVDILVNEDFEMMEHFCDIFKPFKEATVELSSEKGISISKVLILTKVLHSHIKNKAQDTNLPSSIQLMLSKMLIKADKKFRGIEDQPLLTEATLLDPRFKKKAFDNHIVYQRTYEQIVQKVATIIKNNSKYDEHDSTSTTMGNNITVSEASTIWKHFDAQVYLIKKIILNKCVNLYYLNHIVI